MHFHLAAELPNSFLHKFHWNRIYFFNLQRDAAAPLQLVAGGERNGGGDGRRGAGFQAVACTNELRQGLQSVDAQLNELTLECKRAQRGTGSLKGQMHQINAHKCYSFMT